MPNQSNQHQVDIFNPNQQQKQFAELCNALYERELHSLAVVEPKNVSLLQRKLAGLSHHIKNAAEHLLNHTAPIKVDAHNGSWQAKQSAKCVAEKHHGEKCVLWYKAHIKMGLPVPIYVSDQGHQTVELDSVNRIELEEGKIRVNKHGWFSISGDSLEVSTPNNNVRQLLQPTKNNIVAACCGHSWNHKGKTLPRTLTLRELLLSTTIDWKNFR